MNTENEKVVRDPITEAFTQWWKASGGGSVSDEVNASHAWKNSWQAALQSQSNTDGWVMVPVEPTSDQVNDGADAMRQAMAMFNRGRSVQTAARRVYEAMLSAATKAPQQESNTPQDGKLRKALEDVLEQFDPRNHQSFCECDPSVGYQCAACKFPSIPAVSAAYEALAAPPQQQEQSGEAVRHATALEQCAIFAADVGDNIAKAMMDAAAYLRSTSPATPTATASQESAPEQEAVAEVIDNKPYWIVDAMPVFLPNGTKLYAAPPTSTAIAAMVIKQAVEIMRFIGKDIGFAKQRFVFNGTTARSGDGEEEFYSAKLVDEYRQRVRTAYDSILAITPADAEAELEALMMKVAKAVDAKAQYNSAFQGENDLRAIVRRALDEMKGE